MYIHIHIYNERISFQNRRPARRPRAGETRIIVHLFIRSIGNVITTVHNGYGRRNYRANRHLRFIVSLTPPSYVYRSLKSER